MITIIKQFIAGLGWKTLRENVDYELQTVLTPAGWFIAIEVEAFGRILIKEKIKFKGFDKDKEPAGPPPVNREYWHKEQDRQIEKLKKRLEYE